MHLAKSLRPVATVWALFISMSLLAKAATPDSLSYSDQGSSITITRCSQTASGVLEIPPLINGKPVTAIGSYAFSMCNRLTRVTIPAGVTSIGDQTFYECYGLTEMAIPSSVESIGSEAFFYCDGLTRVTFGSGLRTIGASAFAYCTGLKSLILPAKLTSLGEKAFLTCPVLTKATFLGNAPTTGVAVFNEASAGFKIYFSDGKKGFSTPSWRGYRCARLAAEISIQQSTGTELKSGASVTKFGTAKLGARTFKKFTIRNIGKIPLAGLAVGRAGTDAGDFSVPPLLVTELAPGASTTFKVTFKPTAKGTRGAEIRVRSKDRDESTFRIAVSGVGAAR